MGPRLLESPIDRAALVGAITCPPEFFMMYPVIASNLEVSVTL